MSETDIKHFGPMYTERSRRHQMTAESNSKRYVDGELDPERGILTMYETHSVTRGEDEPPAPPRDPRLNVEVMVDGHTHMLKLTVAEARELAGAAAEFVRCWQG